MTEEGLADADVLLQEGSSVALTDQQASDLVGEPLPDVSGTQPYLVRALLLNRGTGNFTVYILEDQVSVKHGSLGGHAVPMRRQPLILQLGRCPAWLTSLFPWPSRSGDPRPAGAGCLR